MTPYQKSFLEACYRLCLAANAAGSLPVPDKSQMRLFLSGFVFPKTTGGVTCAARVPFGAATVTVTVYGTCRVKVHERNLPLGGSMRISREVQLADAWAHAVEVELAELDCGDLALGCLVCEDTWAEELTEYDW